jgi:hypothetical protein
MSTISILLGLALAIAVLFFILEPFIQRRPSLAVAADLSLQSKEAALVAVRDLDFDFQTGKVTDADYQPLRQQLLLTAAEAAQHERSSRAGAQRPTDLEAAIESAVRSARQRGQSAPTRRCPACGQAASAEDNFCGRCGAGIDQACPACLSAVQPGDRFCANCGAALDTKVVPQP